MHRLVSQITLFDPVKHELCVCLISGNFTHRRKLINGTVLLKPIKLHCSQIYQKHTYQ